MGVSGVPQMLGEVLGPLKAHHWAFLLGTALITVLFGMVLEGLPAAVVLIPVVFPIAEAMGIDPIHFNIVQTAAGRPSSSIPNRQLIAAVPIRNRSEERRVGKECRYQWSQ